MTIKRFLVTAVVILVLSSALVLGGLWAGFSLNTALQNRFSLASQIEYKLNGYYNSFFQADTPQNESLMTNRVRLDVTTVYLPLSATDFAGGIATMGPETVLVTDRLGKLFSVTDAETTELTVETPDNRADDLQRQLDNGDLGDIEVEFNWFRYNDILFVDLGETAYLLLSYSEWQPDDLCFNSALARLEVDGADPASWTATADDWEIVTRTEPCLRPFESGKGIYGLEAGGRLAHLGGSRVVWTSGSYERDDRHEGLDFSTALAQDDGTDYGKTMIVDLLTGDKELIAKGLRNPQGVTVDADGAVWVTDHGMRGGDELNLVFEGANFGFPAVSYGTKYNRKPAGNQSHYAGHEGYDKPVLAFVPSIAPAAALAVDRFHYAWDGDILVGALNGSLVRVHVDDGRALFAETIPLGVRIRDLAALEDGTIVVWTDDRRIIYLSPTDRPDPITEFDQRISQITPQSLQDTVGDTFTSCLQCHGLTENEVAAGPSLHGICGREVASASFDGYSDALKSLGGTWTPDRLATFIADPTSIAPGTTMAWNGMENDEAAAVLADVVCLLLPAN